MGKDEGVLERSAWGLVGERKRLVVMILPKLPILIELQYMNIPSSDILSSILL